MNWTINQTVDLSRGYTPVVWPDALMVSGDVGAHTWRLTVLDNGVPADLSGATITGSFLRADGNTVLVSGSVSGNIAIVTLTDVCYAVEGKLVGTMRAVISGATITLAAVVYTVKLLTSGDVVDPGVTYQDFQIDASPAGTYANLAALISANPDHIRIYVTTDDGKWNYWNGTAFVAGGVYQAIALSSGFVTPDKTSFFNIGTNLADESKLINGYVDIYTGTIASDNAWFTSDYIPIDPASSYTVARMREAAFYTTTKTFISGVTGGYNDYTFVSPATASYIRFSFTKAEFNSGTHFHLNKGTELLGYAPYKQYIPKELVEKHPFVIEDIPDQSLPINKMGFVTMGKNLLNPNIITEGYFVNNVYGTIEPNPSYSASDFIEVLPSTDYAVSNSLFLAFYNEAYTHIGGLDRDHSVENRTFTTPAATKYLRVSMPAGSQNGTQVEKGNAVTSFEPYAMLLDYGIRTRDGGSVSDSVLVFLPPKIYVAVGRTIEIYNKQVLWAVDIDNYCVVWKCSSGKALKRKFSFTGTTSKVGTHTLTLEIYDSNLNLITLKTAQIIVTNNVAPANKNILTIGDSLTNGKPWIGELRTLSANKYTMVGTRGSDPLKHEGRSGFSAGSYLVASTYDFESEGVHPFWNGSLGRFDFAYYKTTTGISPDAVQLFLGTNGMSMDPTANVTAIKQIVDYIRVADATIPILVVFTLFRGNQNGIGNEVPTDGYSYEAGAFSESENKKVFNLAIALHDALASYSNLHFIPIAQCHDSEFNFGAVETPVNPRASQTELMASQATHPQEQGYLQMADIMFSAMRAVL